MVETLLFVILNIEAYSGFIVSQMCPCHEKVFEVSLLL